MLFFMKIRYFYLADKHGYLSFLKVKSIIGKGLIVQMKLISAQ